MSVLAFCEDVAKDTAIKHADEIVALIEKGKPELLASVGRLFDRYVEPYDIPGVPNTIEKVVVDPALRKAVLGISESVLDRLVAELKALKAAG